MRLIDADKLNLWTALRPYCSSDVCCEVTDIIDNAPTVNPYEWISVEDRLPEAETTIKWRDQKGQKSVRVLCCCRQKSGKVLVKEGYYEMWDGRLCWRIPGSIDSVTHWMPLPEPPTKGGE